MKITLDIDDISEAIGLLLDKRGTPVRGVVHYHVDIDLQGKGTIRAEVETTVSPPRSVPS